MYKKLIWHDGEQIVKRYYIDNWYDFVEQNFTMRWWELDLIFRKNGLYIFIEVKVVDNIDDLFGYITKNKLKFIKKTIDYYIHIHDIEDYRVDVVFVKNYRIYEIYENIYDINK